jgi:hypothetical protein
VEDGRRVRGQCRPVGRLRHHFRNRVGECLALIRATRRQHLEQDDTERPDIGTLIYRLAFRLLRRHVRQSAHDDAGIRHRRPRDRRQRSGDRCAFGRGLDRLGQPEVQYFHGVVGRDLDVAGLQIAMDDAAFVRSFEGGCYLLDDADGLVDRYGTASEPRRQIHAVDELHDERAILHTIDLRDVRMIEGRERLRLALEPRETLWIGCEQIRQSFDRDVTIQSDIARAIHLAHPA